MDGDVLGGRADRGRVRRRARRRRNWRVVPGDDWCSDRDGDRRPRALLRGARDDVAARRARWPWTRRPTAASRSRPASRRRDPAAGQGAGGGRRATRRRGRWRRRSTSAPRARSPRKGRTRARATWWTVSYRLTVPARTDLDLRSHNGGITLTGVRGRTEFETMNGGVTCADAGGSLRGRTTNGGVKVALSGSPGTAKGSTSPPPTAAWSWRCPPTTTRIWRRGRSTAGSTSTFRCVSRAAWAGDLSTDLGSGGPTIRAKTTNGGVTVRGARRRYPSTGRAGIAARPARRRRSPPVPPNTGG